VPVQPDLELDQPKAEQPEEALMRLPEQKPEQKR
jgi:hypothetical protein